MDETCSSRSLTDWLILIRAPLLSPRLCKQMLDKYSTPGAIIDIDDDGLRRAGMSLATIKSIRQPDWQKIDSDLAWIDSPGNFFISCMDHGFPGLLKFLDDSPLGLFVSGKIDVISRTQLAVVGTRVLPMSLHVP
jgi:DNA processing protein